AGNGKAAARWTGFVETAGPGSVQDANLPFVDTATRTGSIAGGGIAVPGVGRVAIAGKSGARADTPDEARVTRAEKRGRIVSVVPLAPPKRFNAGSVVERSSFLNRPARTDPLTMAFMAPRIQGEEIQIATAFHMREPERKLPGSSSMVAELINNTEPDILATAYAPSGPDYAQAQPFASLLREDSAERRP